MKRWLITGIAMLAAMTLTGLLLPFFVPHPQPEIPARLAAMGLILLEDDAGLYVLGVMDGSRAGSAGIRPGDCLTAAKSIALTSVAQLEDLLSCQESGAVLPLTLARNDQLLTVDLTLQ